MQAKSIFTRFLAELGVPHTDAYSDAQFKGMTFNSLYGLSHLLKNYGVKNEGVLFKDKSKISSLSTPFLAQSKAGIFVIVDKIDPTAGLVEYDSLGQRQKVDLKTFIEAWNGVALLAYPDAGSREPEYNAHRLTEIVAKLANYALVAGFGGLFVYFFLSRGLYTHFSTILLTIFNCVGLYFSFMLLQKTLNIHTAASERVCAVLEEGGCDSIAKSSASKLVGVFSWSEIGFGYFGVSLIVLLLYPKMWPALALCNVFCLPYTCWSIWYQKFKAGHWCTLCVGVQATLWLLFFCYLGGGWLAKALPLNADLFGLLLAYVLSVLSLNLILGIFQRLPCHENNP